MQTNIIGQLISVAEPVKKDSYTSQLIEVNVKEFDTANGSLKSDQTFPITIFNKKIEELKAVLLLKERVMVKCYIKALKSEKDGKTYHNIALNGVSITKV